MNKQDSLDEIKINGIKHKQVSAERGVEALLIVVNNEMMHNNNARTL